MRLPTTDLKILNFVYFVIMNSEDSIMIIISKYRPSSKNHYILRIFMCPLFNLLAAKNAFIKVEKLIFNAKKDVKS